MRRVMVRYKVKPDRAAENEALVRAVYEELRAHPARRAALRDLRAGRRRQLRPPLVDRDRGRAQPAGRGGGVRALPGGHRRSLRGSAGRRAAARDRLVPMADESRPATTRVVPPGAAHRRPAGRERVLLRAPALATRSGSTPAAAPTTRSGWAAPSAAASSSAPTRRPVWLPYVEVRARRRGHRPRRPARGLGAARAARGPGGLAQRRRDARGRGDRLLAAQGAAQRMGGMTERELLDAARARRRGRLRPARRAPPRRSCTPTATACSARSTMPRTRCRTRCCAPGAAWRASRAAARCAPGSTRSRPTPA